MPQAGGNGMPGDLLQLLYIKQLSPSDAASSKQIKLPKNDVKAFLGDLRHKQRAMVVVLDHEQVCWEFLCTCYGCQYALSRVAAFANTYQLRAGQFVVFYMDTLNRLRLMVTDHLPQQLQQYTGCAITQPLHTQTGSFVCSTLPDRPHARNAAAAAAGLVAPTTNTVSHPPGPLWGVEGLQQQQQLAAAHLSCNAAAAAVAAVIAASAPPVTSTVGATSAEQQQVATALSNINALVVNHALHAGLLRGLGTSQLINHLQLQQQPGVQLPAPTAGTGLLVPMPQMLSLQQQQQLQAAVCTHPTFSSSTTDGSSLSWLALSRCVASATTNPHGVQQQVQANAQRSLSPEASDSGAVCWVAAGPSTAGAKDNQNVPPTTAAPCTQWECVSHSTAPGKLCAAVGGDDSSTDLTAIKAAAGNSRTLLDELTVAAAAPALDVTRSGGDIANPDPCNTGELSPACSVSPAEGSAALQVQHQEPFVDLAGADSSPTRCVSFAAGWEARRSIIDRAACPPIFKGPSGIKAGAAASATATHPGTGTAGTDGQIGQEAVSCTAGRDTADADITRTNETTSLPGIPVPSMEDLLLLHYQQEQLRNRHRQQQLDALQESFRTRHAALTNSNSKRAAKLLAAAGTESKQALSGSLHAMVSSTSQDMDAGATLFPDNNSCLTGTEMSAVLPLFKAPAQKASFCLRPHAAVDKASDPGSHIPGNRSCQVPLAPQQQPTLCRKTLPHRHHHMQVSSAADWHANTSSHAFTDAITITDFDSSSNPGSPESAGQSPAAATKAGMLAVTTGPADTVRPGLERPRVVQEAVWQPEAHSMSKPGEVMVVGPADVGSDVREHRNSQKAGKILAHDRCAAAPGLLLLLQAARH